MSSYDLYVATSGTRATDTDRTNTCQVLDSALAEGQLSMEEHRLRVTAATNAITLGELQSLVSDLQIHRAPVQLRNSPLPARVWGIAIVVVVGVVLLGARIGWALLSNTFSPSSPSTTSSVATPPPTSPGVATTTAPPDLLSVGGLSGLLAQMGRQFGDTMGYELTVYPGYAVLERPDTANAHKTVSWYYQGGWKNMGPGVIPSDSAVGDLAKFNVQEVIGVLNGAPQSLHVSDATETYLIVDSATDGSLALQVHLSDGGSNSGYMLLAADGTVTQIHPAGS